MDLTYTCPYNAWDWDTQQATFHSNYAYPMVLKYPLLKCSSFTITAELFSSYTIPFNRSWEVQVYTGSSWYVAATFTMPAATDRGSDVAERYYASITVDVTLSTKRNITKIVAVPATTINRSYTWSQFYTFYRGAVVTETLTPETLVDGNSFCGIYSQRSGLKKKPATVYTNIGGSLTEATAVLVNIDGELVNIPKMKQFAFLPTTKHQRTLLEFTPTNDATYTIDSTTPYSDTSTLGDADMLIFDKDLMQLESGVTTNISFDMVAGNTYYILVIDSPDVDELASKMIKIYF